MVLHRSTVATEPQRASAFPGFVGGTVERREERKERRKKRGERREERKKWQFDDSPTASQFGPDCLWRITLIWSSFYSLSLGLLLFLILSSE
jgi:hypothetical protein